MIRKIVSGITLAVLVGVMMPAQAEISGSGSPNSGCFGQLNGSLWHDVDGNGIAATAESGLAGVRLHLYYSDGSASVSAVTGVSGEYQFGFLCPGNYIVVVDETTIPENLSALITANSGHTELGGWAIEIIEANNQFDLPYQGCNVAVSASCTVESLASELYRCEKKIDELRVIWNGSDPIRLLVHEGNDDSPVLAELDEISSGEMISISGLEAADDDIIWEIFEAGTENKIGESRFKLNCDDEEMDGPEDCGLPQGNGKDNKSNYLNDWLLEGIRDDSGLLDCSPTSLLASSTCEIASDWADCDLIDKVRWLTFTYTGGGCDASVQNQGDKFECSGQLESAEPITVLTESGDSFVVFPGGSFTVPVEGSDTELELSNPMGTESVRLNTSCSEPLAAGDIYGSLTLSALNGIGSGAQIHYEYELQNNGVTPVNVLAKELPDRTLYQQEQRIESSSLVSMAGTAYVSRSIDRAFLAQNIDGTVLQCDGADSVDVIVSPPAPCEISGSGLHIHGDELRWELTAGSNVGGVLERLAVSWPDTVTNKLKEVKLDGDKIFDRDSYGSSVVITATDLEGEYKKRRINHAATKQLKIKFDSDLDQAVLSDFTIEADFKQGCRIAW
ncbi:MAG: hypothetical protein HKM98_07675 [Gammaproteobacteria bacterium]|nr:hypothetical protein [Gammaproteobacteria bacterium]